MTPDEAKQSLEKGDGKITLRVYPSTTYQSITANLYYYGFVRDEDALKYALEHTPDTTPKGGIKVGENGTIELNAEYRISEDMSAWEIADILLNKPSKHFNFDDYGYIFMP